MRIAKDDPLHPPSTSSWLSDRLRMRLTVCSVVPVISAQEPRQAWRCNKTAAEPTLDAEIKIMTKIFMICHFR